MKAELPKRRNVRGGAQLVKYVEDESDPLTGGLRFGFSKALPMLDHWMPILAGMILGVVSFLLWRRSIGRL